MSDFDFDDFDFGDVDTSSINDDVDVENIVKAVYKTQEELAFLKKLKAKRVAPIDEKLKKLTEKEQKLKSFIMELMKVHFPNKNSVDFPGVGKITKRIKKGKWEIEDDEELAKLLKDYKVDGEAITSKTVIVKKFIPAAMAEILKHIDQDDISCATFVEPEETHSLSVKFYESEDDESDIGF